MSRKMSRWQALGPTPPGSIDAAAAAGAGSAQLPLDRPLTTVRTSMNGSVVSLRPYNAQVPQVTDVRESPNLQAQRLRNDMRMGQKFEGGPLGMSAILKNVNVAASKDPLYKAPGGRRTRKKHRRHRRKTRRTHYLR